AHAMWHAECCFLQHEARPAHPARYDERARPQARTALDVGVARRAGEHGANRDRPGDPVCRARHWQASCSGPSEVRTTHNRSAVMHILATLIIGLIVGALAKLVMPGRDPGGIIVTILLGIAGSFIAGALGHSLGWYAIGEGPGLLASILGAVILLAIYRVVVRPRRTW